MAIWVSKLLDLGVFYNLFLFTNSNARTGLIEVRGTMTDCPEKLSTGLGLMVTLHIYILKEAFKPLRLSDNEENSNVNFNEGYETYEERFVLRSCHKLY